ncbi:MAG TPA: VIT1/CCC1 transporter family protein [Candidatus Saccharimonadales bacterium]|nr:VIT1/CCC1 transporter family protein [Candidatus Saccharimonadales bacterium]
MHIQTAKRKRLLKAKRHRLNLPFGAQRLLALFEGLEGGFAIGASVIVGLSFADLDRRILLISAGIGILVNGFNNASVKYSSEHYSDELDGREKRHSFKYYFVPAAIEFVSYFVISVIALLPLFFISNLYLAIALCCLITLVMLFVAGYWRGYLMKMHPAKDGIEMLILGACIIIVGGATGYFLHLIHLMTY